MLVRLQTPRAWPFRLLTAAVVVPLLGAALTAAALMTTAYYRGVRQSFLAMGIGAGPSRHSDLVMVRLAEVADPTIVANLLAVVVSILEMMAQLAFVTAFMQMLETWRERRAGTTSAPSSEPTGHRPDRREQVAATVVSALMVVPLLFFSSAILLAPVFGRRVAEDDFARNDTWLHVVHTWAEQIVAQELVFGPWVSVATSWVLALALQVAVRVAQKVSTGRQAPTEIGNTQ